MTGITTCSHGSLIGIYANTDAAASWLRHNTEGSPCAGPVVWAERRYAGPIVEAMLSEGFTHEHTTAI